MIPGRRLVIAVALLSLPLLASGLSQTVADAALLLNLILVALACVDLWISPSPSKIQVERQVSSVLSVGTSNPVTLAVRNGSMHPLRITVHDDAGPLCHVEKLPQELPIPAGTESVFHYSVRPLKRGASQFERVYLRFPTRLGFWTRRENRVLMTLVSIYPDIRAVYRYELMAQRNRLAELGVRSTRIAGQGREFERLREYRQGDELRQIDWKATARQRALISREFTVERNQNIVILVDCGRFMKTEAQGISFLDCALNAALMLSYIALSQGDNVSMLAFSGRIERYVRPVRGTPGIRSILQSTYDLQVSPDVPDFSLALEYLMRVQRKRALVVLITCVTDEMQLRVIGDSLRLRSLPWLPLCVLLQDEGLRQMAEQIPETSLQAFHAAAAAQILTGQMTQAAALRESGVQLLDTFPDQLSTRLINEYLRIKTRNLM